MKQRTIGIKANYYPEKRNFSGLLLNGYQFVKVLDFYRVIAFLYFKLRKTTHPKWLNLFFDFNLGKYDCLHFFNAVSLGNRPWVTTFEYFLPRGAHQIGVHSHEEKYIDKAISALSSSSCKAIIAISNHAKLSQIDYLAGYKDSQKSRAIINKIEVLHPSQSLIIESLDEKIYTDCLNLILIGADFFRKGGLEVLQIVDEVLQKGLQVKLIIISALQYGDYASVSTKSDLLAAKEIINMHSEITHFSSKPNQEVLELLKISDIALLPSYDETYGYSVLEAQACGCPVVTTNGGAFKEINNNNCGWIIEVPLKGNRSIPYGDKAKGEFQNIVRNGLRKIIFESIGEQEMLRRKGDLCIERIRKMHSIKNATAAIKRVYDNALSN